MPRDYDSLTERVAADEFDALSPGAVLREFIIDYAVLRKQARDCWDK